MNPVEAQGSEFLDAQAEELCDLKPLLPTHV